LAKKKSTSIRLPVEAPPMVMVAWEDAKVLSGDAWVQNEEFTYSPYIVYQMGYLITDVPEGVIITDTWSKELLGPPTQIPRSMIRDIRYLD
jgi:hypothetical protein